MRVYIPATMTMLHRLRAERSLRVVGRGFAVTPTLREWYAEGSLEEMEYVALTAGARASLTLLAADPEVARRRVVLAADLPDASVSWASTAGRAAVELSADVRIGAVAAVHVDEPAAVAEVQAAVVAIPAAESGDADAAFTVEGADAVELQWWATQELDALLD